MNADTTSGTTIPIVGERLMTNEKYHGYRFPFTESIPIS